MGDNAIIGRKTFFIAPDANMLPDSYLKNFMIRGYETYYIHDDSSCPLKVKVETLIDKYPGCLMFFCVDTPVSSLNWQTFVMDMRYRRGNDCLMFVLCERRETPEQVRQLESYYIKELGMENRLITIKKGDKGNFSYLDHLLEQNEARGRRKSVRAICDETSSAAFVRNYATTTAKLLDVSVTHFSCEFSTTENQLPFYEKIQARLSVNGLSVKSDAVMILNRVKEGIAVGIFMFVKENGTPGMTDEVAATLGGKIYDMVASETKIVMRQAFNEALAKSTI